MLLLRICCILLFLSAKNYAEEFPGDTVQEYIQKKIEVINAQTAEELVEHDIIKLREPAATVACDKTNGNRIKIIRDIGGYFFFLSVNELFAVKINSNNAAEVFFIGTLLDIAEHDTIIDIQIEQWKNFLLVIIQQQSTLKIYLVKFDPTNSPDINHIQRIDISSVTDKFKVFRKGDDVILVMYRINEKAANELIFYTWETSYFSKEIIEDAEVPNKSYLYVFNENVEETIILSIGYGIGNESTQVVSFKYDESEKRWKKLQKLRFKKDYIEYYSIHGKLYVIACFADSYCAIYKWDGLKFKRHIKIASNAFEIIKSIYSHHSIIIVEDFQKKLSFYSTSDITGVKPGYTMVKSNEISEYATYKSLEGYLYFVKISKNETSLQLSFYEMTITNGSAYESNSDTKVNDPIECVIQLKAAMKSRVAGVKSSERNAKELMNNPGKLNIRKKRHIKAKHVTLRDTVVRQLKMPYNVSVHKSEMSEKIVRSNILLEEVKRNIENGPSLNTGERVRENMNSDPEKLQINNLIYKGNQPIFKDIVMKSQSIISFGDQISLETVSANKVTVASNLINKIPLNILLNATVTKSVSGKKKIKRLTVNKSKISDTINNVPMTFLNSTENRMKDAQRIDFKGDINVEHLNVKVLNQFDVQKLISHLYQRNNNTTVFGDLFVRGVLNIKNLAANHINEVPINNFMTTVTDQTIETNLMISKFHTSTVEANLLNNELTTNFALSHEKSFIEVPTKFEFLNVVENLKIEDAEDESGEFKNFIDAVRERVIGTNESDLAQFYNGKVVIQGSLTVNDLNAYSPRTKFFIADQRVPLNISANYWMKSIKQDILSETFVLTNKVEFNGVATKFISNHPADNYLRTDLVKEIQPIANLRFKNAIVKGNINGHLNNVPSLLFKLNDSVIKIDGEPTEISSPVEFRNNLVINKLYTGSINGIKSETLVHKHLLAVVFEAPKVIEVVNVDKHLIVDNNLDVVTYNNVDLQSFSNGVQRIDQPMFLKNLVLKRFNAFNLTVDKLESHNLNQMIENLREELDLNRVSNKGKRSVRIHGDATFTSNIFIELLNGEIEFNEFVNLLVFNKEQPQEIGGRKIFKEGLTVAENLNTISINGNKTYRLLHQSLSRGDDQTISSEMFVTNLKVNGVRTRGLNGIAWNMLINKEKLHQPLKINMNIDQLEVKDLFTKTDIVDFTRMIKIAHFPERTQWNSITAIKGNELLIGTATYLDQLMINGVLKSVRQEIFADVTFQKTFYMEHVKKQDYFIGTRTDTVDMKALDDDSVKQNSPKPEVILGRKIINPGFRFDAVNLIIGPQCNFYSTFINNVNIIELNRTIYRNGDYLNAPKHFDNLVVEDLYVQDGILGGIPLNSIVTIYQDNVRLDNIKFESLEVGNLTTYMFNSYSLLHFLKGRMRKHGVDNQVVTTFLTFNSLNLETDADLSTINSINVNNAVYLKSDQLQVIEGRKIITGSLILKGPVQIGTVNGVDLMEFNKNTVSINQNYLSDVPLKLFKVQLKNGMYVMKTINGKGIDDLLSSNAHSPKLNDLMTLIANVTKQILEIDHQKSIKSKRQQRMLYIDVDDEISVSYKEPRSTEANDCPNRVRDLSFRPKPKGVIMTLDEDEVMTVDLPNVKFKLDPNFECYNNEVSSKVLDINWSYPNDLSKKIYFQNLTIEGKVKDVNFMESSDGLYTIIVVQQQIHSKNNLKFYRLNRTSHDIIAHQATLINFYESTKIAIVESSKKEHYLVVSTFKKDSDRDWILIYQFNMAKGQFVEIQKIPSNGNFDIILGINMKPFRGFRGRTFLLFAKTNGKQIKIYQKRDESKEFTFERQIDDFKDSIVEVLILYINQKPFIVVSQTSGLFCLYEWHGIESWKSKYCGRFENIRQMKSFEYLNRQHLFLASITHNTTPSINALGIYRQGE